MMRFFPFLFLLVFVSTEAIAVVQQPQQVPEPPVPPSVSVSVPFYSSGNTPLSGSVMFSKKNMYSGQYGNGSIYVLDAYGRKYWSTGFVSYSQSFNLSNVVMPTQGWANGNYKVSMWARSIQGLYGVGSTYFSVNNRTQISLSVINTRINNKLLYLNGSANLPNDPYWGGKYGYINIQILNPWGGSVMLFQVPSYSSTFPLSNMGPIFLGSLVPGDYTVVVSASAASFMIGASRRSKFTIVGNSGNAVSTPVPLPVSVVPFISAGVGPQVALASSDQVKSIPLGCNEKTARNIQSKQDLLNTGETNPINLATGDKFLTNNLIVAGGMVVDISYHSRSTFDGDMGFGWSWTYGWSVRDVNGKTEVRRGDGKLMVFPPLGSNSSTGFVVAGNWTGHRLFERTDEVLEKTVNGWIYHAHDRSSVTFNSYGKAVLFTRENGQSVTVVYDATQSPIAIKDSFGKEITIVTTVTGKIASFSNVKGNIWQFNYDMNGNLVLEAHPDSNSRQYTYSDSGDLHNLTDITNEKGIHYAHYAYDLNDRAILSEHLYGNMHTVRYETGKTTVIDANGVSRQYILSTNTNIPMVESVGQTTSGCGAINFTYSTTGNLVSSSTGGGVVTKLIRNPNGDTVSRVEGSGLANQRVWVYGYDSSGRVISISKPDSSITQIGYDLKGRVIEEADSLGFKRSFIWNPDSTLSSVTDKRGNTTSFTYSNGDVSSVLLADGASTSYVRDAIGRVISLTDEKGYATNFVYNWRNQITRVDYPDGTAMQFDFDPLGKVISIVNRDGTRIQVQRDNENRPVTITYPNGTVKKVSYSQVGNVDNQTVMGPGGQIASYEGFTYNEIHLPLKQTHADSSFVQYGYDKDNKLVTLTNEAGNALRFSHNPFGEVSELISENASKTTLTYNQVGKIKDLIDPIGVKSTFQYDNRGYLISESSPDTGLIQFTHDPNGNVISKVDAHNITVKFGYDTENRLISETFVSDSSRNITFQYDVRGKLAGFDDVTGSTLFQRNVVGDVISKSWTPLASSKTFAINRAYDGYGRPITLTYPSGNQITYSYDTYGQVSSIAFGAQNIVSNVKYHPSGRMVSFLSGSGYQEYRMFDMRGRMTKVNGKQVSYSSTSDILGITDLSVPAASQTFAYDPEHHLTDANGSYGTISYVYDSNANRTSKNLVTIPYAIGTNMVSSVVRDVAGNRVSDSRFQYIYAVNDRLAEVIDLVGNRVASYRHNALGQRQIKTVAGKTTWFVYGLYGELLSEIDQTTGDETDYIYNAGERLASIRADGSVLWFHNDHLGTPMSFTDNYGTVVWSASYTPFGLATVSEDPDGNGITVTNNLRFQGQYFDSETGLHYNYHRTYDPNLGRYTQSDPIGLLGGSNRFGYVNANPVGSVDLYGLDAMSYMDRVAKNFNQTNEAIPGATVVTGSGLLTVPITAKAVGGITLRNAIGFYGTGKLGGALFFIGVTSSLNFIATSGWFETGILMGSAINAIEVDSCGTTIKDLGSEMMLNIDNNIRPWMSDVK